MQYPSGTTINGNAVSDITRSQLISAGLSFTPTIPDRILVVPGTTIRWSVVNFTVFTRRVSGSSAHQLSTITGTFFPADSQTIAQINFTDLAQTPAALGTPGQQLLVNAQRDALFFADQYPAGTLPSSAVDNATEAKRAAWRAAIGVTLSGGGVVDQNTNYLADDADLNDQVDNGLHTQLTNSVLTNAPFSGPLILFVQATTHSEGGPSTGGPSTGGPSTHSLTQQVWSLDRPGLYAERQSLGNATKPTSITAAWRPHHSRAQLPQTLNDVTEVVMEALEDEPASYRPTPIEIGMAVDGTGTYYSAAPNSHGFRKVSTDGRAFNASDVGANLSSVTPIRNRLLVLVADSAFGGRLIKTGGTLNFRWTPQLGINRDAQVVALETLVDGQDYLLLQGTAVLSGDQGASLRQAVDGYIEFTDSVDNSTRFAPGSYQPESIRQSRFNMPMRNGAPAYLVEAGVDARVAALRPNPFTTAEKAKLAGIQGRRNRWRHRPDAG